MTTTTKTYEFQADISRLMNMIINSFYSNKDVFLRELISNASDAIDKARIEDLSAGKVTTEYHINISADKENKTLLIEDNGIGMDEDDLVKNLSTIAHSGTKDFADKLSSKSISDFIGQFGVGFYASYLVAKKVEVYTKKADGKTYHWESDAGSSYSIREVDDADASPKLERGTIILLHLKDEEHSYLEETTIKNTVKQHSQFISYPIQLLVEKEETVTKNPDIEEVDEEEVDGEVKVEEVEENDEKEAATDTAATETVKVPGWETLNGDKPIWYSKSDDLTVEDYNKFYKTISNDYQEPLVYRHFEAEGSLEFRGILYIPSQAPFDMFEQTKKKRNIKLYVKKVFIMDDCRELVPEWMSFVSGIIDSCDLPLNVSREMLQQNKVVQSIKKHITKQVLKMLDDLGNDEEKFKKFYDSFGKNVKLAIYEGENKLAKFLRYQTNLDETAISLDDYVDKMKEEQKSIYYLSGDSLATVRNSTFLKKFTKLGYRVLFLTEPIDEFMIQKLNKYGDFDLVNITKDEVKLSEDDKEQEKVYEGLCKYMKETLGDKVESVKLSTRLENEPTCIVTSKFGWSANMERIMKAQALGDNKNMMFMQGRKILEINPEHKLIQKLKTIVDEITSAQEKEADASVEPDAVEPDASTEPIQETEQDTSIPAPEPVSEPHPLHDKGKDITNLLYDVALLHAGFTIDNMSSFSEKLYGLVV